MSACRRRGPRRPRRSPLPSPRFQSGHFHSLGGLFILTAGRPRTYPRTYPKHMPVHILCAHTPVHSRVCAPNSWYVQSMCALHVPSDQLMCPGRCAELRGNAKRHRCMCGRQSACAQHVRGYVRKSPRGTITCGKANNAHTGARTLRTYPAHIPAHIPNAHTRAHAERTYPAHIPAHIPTHMRSAHTQRTSPPHAVKTSAR